MDEEAVPAATPSAADVVLASPDPAVAETPAAAVMIEPPATQLSLRVLEEQISALTAQLREQTTQLSEHTSLASHREQTISRLHNEIQELRKGELEQALAPVVRDLIRLHDDLAAFVIEEKEKGREDAEKVIGYFRDEAERMLDRTDVVAFDPMPGERFDPSQHRALRSAPTGDPALDRTIESVQRRGFRRGARVVRAAEVVVYRTDPTMKPNPSTGSGESSVKGDAL
jgi:molecular chaperone GrpE (heat shock protein)